MLSTVGTLAPPPITTAVTTATSQPLYPLGTQTLLSSSQYFSFPKVTNSTYLRQAAEGIISILSKKHNPSSHPSLSFGSPILNAYLQVAQILQRSVQTPPPPPLHTPPIHGKLPSSVPRVSTPSLPRVDPPPLPRVPSTHRYPTRHTQQNQPRPAVTTSASVINTTTGAKSSLQTLRSSPDKATWEILTANDFSA